MERAFPRHLSTDVRAVLEVLPAPSHPTSPRTIGPVVVAGEHLEIPARVYFAEDDDNFGHLTTRQRVVSYWQCYYRYDFPRRDQYPGSRVLARFESWMGELAQRGPEAT
jgi:hypothetical protein